MTADPVPAQPLPSGTTRLAGLTGEQPARTLAQEDPNALPGSELRLRLRIAARLVREPMFPMLLAAGSIYLAVGDPAEAAFLLGSVFAVVGLTLAQERKTQRALEALRDLSAPRALVIRDGFTVRDRPHRRGAGDHPRGHLAPATQLTADRAPAGFGRTGPGCGAGAAGVAMEWLAPARQPAARNGPDHGHPA